MTQNQLLEKIKNICQREMSQNKRFHDYAHVFLAFNNAKEIISGEKAALKINTLAVLTATLFHDLSNYERLKGGKDSARKAQRILEKLDGFPKGLIKEVKRLILSVEKQGRKKDFSLDERIINDADNLEALSKLSICRGFMIYGKRGLKPQEAILDFQAFINKKRKQMYTRTAKRMVLQQVRFIKKFLDDCAKLY